MRKVNGGREGREETGNMGEDREEGREREDTEEDRERGRG